MYNLTGGALDVSLLRMTLLRCIVIALLRCIVQQEILVPFRKS